MKNNNISTMFHRRSILLDVYVFLNSSVQPIDIQSSRMYMQLY